MRSSQEMVIFPLQLHFTTIVVIFLTFNTLMNGINGSYDYEECSQKLISCGKISKIGYPFWSDDLGRPKHCGHPAMKLECSTAGDSDHKHPILSLGGDEPVVSSTYKILAIRDFAITISLLDLDSSFPHCLIIPFYTQVDAFLDYEHHLLTYSSNVTFISLLECESRKDATGVNGSDLITVCPYDNQTTAYYQRSSTSELRESCKTFDEEIPVLIKEFDDYLGGGNQTLQDVLEKGFEVEFSSNYSEACLHCRHSVGECGSSESDHSQFMCYCKNGQYYPHHCPVNSAPEPASAVPDTSGHKKHAKITVPIAIAIPVGIFILTALIVGIFWCTKHKFRSPTLLSRIITDDHIRSDIEFGNSFLGIPIFSYTELQEATNYFDRELGDGGFGVVYHGKLKDGREVAVKRLYERNYKRVQQFRNEVEILTKLSHPNLVTLYGCSSRHSRELLLVYEYIPNGTVADHLYGDRSDSKSLTWTIRMKIAVQTSEALSYLHASDIIHRDIKTNNILLDDNFTVKVADFGLSRLFPFDVTHISTAPQGTPGYLDPEYHKCYQVTNKSDVYSFGVVLIELISSLPAIDFSRNEDEINLSTYAMKKIQNGKLHELADQRLGFESNFKVNRMVTLVAELAFQCLQQEKEVRPSMKEVLEGLKRTESVDYEALEAEEMNRGSGISKMASRVAEDNEVDDQELHLRDAQNLSSSPKSVIVGLASGSTISNTSG